MTFRGRNAGVGYALGMLGTLIALGSPGLAAASAGGAKPPGAETPTARATVPQGQLPPFTKLQYDSMLSVNDRCAVRHGHLNPNIRPVYVNRQPVGFC